MRQHRRVVTMAVVFVGVFVLVGMLLALGTPKESLAAGLSPVSAASNPHQSAMSAIEHDALMLAAQVTGDNGANDPHAGAALNAINSTLDDFHLPGTQQGGLSASPLAGSTACTSCHNVARIKDDYNGSMMTNGMRDPLFRAALVIANKDAKFGGDLCIRCHSPNAWLNKRSTDPAAPNPDETDGRLVNADDIHGIPCTACHRMAPPTPIAGEAAGDAGVRAGLTGPFILGSGGYLIDTADVRRGPFNIGSAPHAVAQSSFLRSAELCATCHDIDNPLLTFDNATQEFTLNTLGTAATPGDRLFPLDRSYSEWEASKFNPLNGGVSGLDYPGLKRSTETINGPITVCQDCHMPMETGPIASGGPNNRTLGAHRWVGANVNWQDSISNTWDTVAGDTLFDKTQTLANKQLGQALLSKAAKIEAAVINGQLAVTVTNNTGHKLPTGYAEGRQMWIEVSEFDDSNTLVFSSGIQSKVVGPLDHDDPYLKVYDAHAGLTVRQAAATGLPEGESFHIILNNKIFKDNRIPPQGFTNAAFEARDMEPVKASYADGQYRDTTFYPLDPAATAIFVSLRYQTASAEYLEFLSDEANFITPDAVRGDTNWGKIISDELAANATRNFDDKIGKSFLMTSVNLNFPREYVAKNGVDTGDCTNPAAPCLTINYALGQVTTDGTEIRVASGIYNEAVLIEKNFLKLSGGFTTTNWITPTWTTNITILDGQNSYRPVTVKAEGVEVGGFTVRNGNANSSPDSPHFGGGILFGFSVIASNGRLFNLQLENNVANTDNSSQGNGGGLFAQLGNNFSIPSSLTLNNVTALNNKASTTGLSASGGGMAISAQGVTSLDVDMSNVTVRNNTAGFDFGSVGGGVSLNLRGGTATIRQSKFLNNHVTANKATSGGTNRGGGIYLSDGNLEMENVLIAGNDGELGGALSIVTNIATGTVGMNYVTLANNYKVKADAKSAVHIEGSQVSPPLITLNLTNTLISGNSPAFESVNNPPVPTINYDHVLIDNDVTKVISGTITENGTPLRGSADYVNAGSGDFHLKASSDAVDAGNSQPPPFDLDSVFRPKGIQSDIGAYEFIPSNLLNQTINFAPLVDKAVTDPPFQVNATASSGLAVSFASTTPGVCSLSTKTVTLLTTGTCTIKATQPGNGAYNPAPPVSRSFAVTSASKTNQTINFVNPGNKVVTDADFSLSASATSNLPVSFSGNSDNICTVTGSTVNLIAVGTCSITATQNGDATFNPATPVTLSFAVLSEGGNNTVSTYLPGLSKH